MMPGGASLRCCQRRGVVPCHSPQSKAQKLRGNQLTARFIGGWLSRLQQPQQPSRSPLLAAPADVWEARLEHAEALTFNAPPGQLLGRSGRRCTLEDAERVLECYMRERGHDLRARLLLLRNLMRQGLGREREVPWQALRALQEADVPDPDLSGGCCVAVLQVVLLGLKALHRLEVEGANIPVDPAAPALTRAEFLAGAGAAVPAAASDMRRIADRLHHGLCSRSPEQRRALLSDRDGFMSCVDLQRVCGEHHAASAEGSDDNWPASAQAQLC